MSVHPEPQTGPCQTIMDGLWSKVSVYNPQADKERLYGAFEFARDAHAGQMRKSGEPFFMHALTVADILADLRMDVDTLIAAMVHDVVEDTDFEIQDIIGRFGKEVANMVNGVTKISGLTEVNKEARKAETYRKRCPGHRQRSAHGADQAGGPAAQHAHHRIPRPRPAAGHRPGDDGCIRALRQPLRHRADQVGAGGPGLQGADPGQVLRDRARHQPDPRRA